MTKMITNHLSMDQSTEINTQSIRLNYQKSNASSVQDLLSLQDSQINLPSMCDLLANSAGDCGDKVVIQKVKNLIREFLELCTKKNISIEFMCLF